MKALIKKGPTDKAKEPDPGGSDQQNLGYRKLKNRKSDRTVGLNYCISLNDAYKYAKNVVSTGTNFAKTWLPL